MTYEVELAGRRVLVDVREHPEGGFLVALDGAAPMHVDAEARGAAEWLLRRDGRSRVARVSVRGDRVDAQLSDGTGVRGAVVDPRDQALAALAGGGEGAVKTPMPGAVVRVLAKPGDPVTKGQVLVVVEAMKMENEFKAPIDGTVEAVHVEAGTSVDAGALLITVGEDA